MRYAALAAFVLALAVPAAARSEPPKVVASIVPVHSIVAGVMAGIGEPHLLLSAAISEHTASLKPSEARLLTEAELVFWVGETIESFLPKPLRTLAARAHIVKLTAAPGLSLLPVREGPEWAHHDHGHDAADETDGHVWLDPMNAKAIATVAAATLADRDPANAAAYRQNAEALGARLDRLDADLAARLAPLRGVPFVVFHDAYQYYEVRYALTAVGAVTVSAERKPGARRLREIRDTIKARGARCVFSEPQFDARVVDALVGGDGGLRHGVLDPLGARIAPGPDAYFKVMEKLTRAVSDCLGGQP
jgi:zinc transport system substrate-binding protein